LSAFAIPHLLVNRCDPHLFFVNLSGDRTESAKGAQYTSQVGIGWTSLLVRADAGLGYVQKGRQSAEGAR
jgi:hypothetical protein